MEKDVHCNLLLDFYGNLLTKKQREIMELYVEFDTGLSEIASMMNASRQSVYESIKVSENLLENFEEKLGCVKKYLENRNTLLESIDLLEKEANQNANVKKALENVRKVLDNQ